MTIFRQKIEHAVGFGNNSDVLVKLKRLFSKMDIFKLAGIDLYRSDVVIRA